MSEPRSDDAPGGPIRVAVIGAGGIARNMHLPSLAEMDDVEVVAVCDILEGRAREMADKYAIARVYTLYREMLAREEFDAAFVLVEPGNLYHVAWHCLDAGRHVFMEKPPGVTCYQAESLAREADEAGRTLQVGFNRRHIPLVRHVKQIVEEAAPINQVEGCFFKCGSGAFDRGSVSAFLSDTIHAVDLVRWLAGGEPVVAATVIGTSDEPVATSWNSVCRFDNGVTGVVRGNYRTGARVHQFQIHAPGLSAYLNLGFGEGGCDAVLLSHAGGVQYSLAARGTGDRRRIEIDGNRLAGGDEMYKSYGFFQEDRHFLDCLRDGTRPETDIHDAVKSMKLAEMILANAI
jgi:virulence factor